MRNNIDSCCGRSCLARARAVQLKKACQKQARRRHTRASADVRRQRCESLTSDASQKLYWNQTRALWGINCAQVHALRLCAKSAPKKRQEAAYRSFCRRRTPTMRIVDVRCLAEALPETKHARFGAVNARARTRRGCAGKARAKRALGKAHLVLRRRRSRSDARRCLRPTQRPCSDRDRVLLDCGDHGRDRTALGRGSSAGSGGCHGAGGTSWVQRRGHGCARGKYEYIST